MITLLLAAAAAAQAPVPETCEDLVSFVDLNIVFLDADRLSSERGLEEDNENYSGAPFLNDTSAVTQLKLKQDRDRRRSLESQDERFKKIDGWLREIAFRGCDVKRYYFEKNPYSQSSTTQSK